MLVSCHSFTNLLTAWQRERATSRRCYSLQHQSCRARATVGDSAQAQAFTSRRQALLIFSLPALTVGSTPQAGARTAAPLQDLSADEAQRLTDKQWRERLTSGQYRVLRKQGTELPLTSGLHNEHRTGTYRCAGCGNAVFSSATKFESGTGWPSFYDAIPDAVKLTPDDSIPFFPRTEVSCSRCHGHLGHVFADGPKPTGLRGSSKT